MCLTIPGRIIAINGDTAKVDFGPLIKDANLGAIMDAKVGDYVMVQQGFLIEKLDSAKALESIQLIKQQIELTEGIESDKINLRKVD